MQPESAAFLDDAHEAASRIAVFIMDLDGDTYATSELHRSAVERQLEIIGEALNSLRKVDPATAARVSELRRIIGLRNILAHGYAVVDDTVVWDAASRHVPELLAGVGEMLAELE